MQAHLSPELGGLRKTWLSSRCFRSRAFLAAFCAVGLTACTTVPVATMVKLARLSPLESNPADMRFAAQTPEWLQVEQGDMYVVFAFDSGTAETSFSNTYYPAIQARLTAVPGHPDSQQTGTSVFLAELSKEDAADIRAAQLRVKAIRANGVKGSGLLSIKTTGCAAGPVPEGPIRITSWISTTPDPDYYVLSRNLDARAELEKAGYDNGLINKLRKCTGRKRTENK